MNERTLNRWYAEGLKELRQGRRKAEEPQREGGHERGKRGGQRRAVTA